MTVELEGKSLLAIWKRDVPHLQRSGEDRAGIGMLRHFAQSHLLLPMQPEVAAYLQSEKLPYLWPDALLDKNGRNACSARAEHVAGTWAGRFGAKSAPALLYFDAALQLTTLFTAEALADSWLEAGVSKVSALHHGPLRTNGYWMDGDLPQAVWLDILGDRYEPLDVHALLAPSSLSLAGPSLYRRLLKATAEKDKRAALRPDSGARENSAQKWRAGATDYACVQGAIAVFLHPHYAAERDAHLVRQLKKSGRVCVFLLTTTAEELRMAAEALEAPVFVAPGVQGVPSPGMAEHIDELSRHVARTPTAGAILAEYLCRSDCSANAACEWLAGLFSRHRPGLACSSQISDVRMRYFERACLNMGIPVIGVPHASLQGPRQVLLEEEDLYVFATASRICETCHDHAALAARACSLEGFFVADEYRMDSFAPVAAEKPGILFIHALSQTSPGLIYFDGPSERADLLRALANPPEAVRAMCAAYHKLHPVWFDMASFQAAGLDPASVLPASSNLGDLLEKVSVAVMVNYVGNPSQQAILKNIPLIHLNTTKTEASIRYDSPLGVELRGEGAMFAFSVQEMWDIIARLLQNERYRQDFLARQNTLKPLFLPSRLNLAQLASRTMKDPASILRFPMRGTLTGRQRLPLENAPRA